MQAKEGGRRRAAGGSEASCRKCGQPFASHFAGEETEGLCASCYQEDFPEAPIPRLTILDARPGWPLVGMGYYGAGASASPALGVIPSAPSGAPQPAPAMEISPMPLGSFARIDMERTPLFAAAVRDFQKK